MPLIRIPHDLAICCTCDEGKFGCLVRCPACGAGSGGDPETMAISLLLSDWHMTPEVLDEVGTRLRAGGTMDDPGNSATGR